jgi:L-alanine-DL-glutamate epimerase-like enolase superfamily enzyme
MNAPTLALEAIDLYERDVTLRMPFRFGVVTLRRAPQAYVRVRIRVLDGAAVGRRVEGMAAELMAPKWFDKNPALSNDDNIDQLRKALQIARDLYLDDRPANAFGHFARNHRRQIDEGARCSLPTLVANYGPALIDRAVLDALCRALGLSFQAAMNRNLAGMAVTDLTPDLARFDLAAMLAGLRQPDSIAARHTVGLVDPISAADQAERVGDGLPETLEEVIATYGHRWYKLKVSGQVTADVGRLARIAAVLDARVPDYRVTLDGNEQFDDVAGVLELWRAMRADGRLQRLCDRVAFIEQPIRRQAALASDVRPLADHRPVIIDESDDRLDAFVQARELGYQGVSSKTCKGIYRSLLNHARCRAWNAAAGSGVASDGSDGTPPRWFLSAEDLTIQAGLALQQDLALVALLGITHVERNGHHYVNGMMGLPNSEQTAFVTAHPDLYERSHGAVRLRIRDGRIGIGSLGGVGFASGAAPDWSAMRVTTSTMRSGNGARQAGARPAPIGD